jgi:hypothetical protein
MFVDREDSALLHQLSHCVTAREKDRGSSIDQQPALQRTNTENSKQTFPEKELRGHNPNFHIHVPASDLYISTIDLSILLREIFGPIFGNI